MVKSLPKSIGPKREIHDQLVQKKGLSLAVTNLQIFRGIAELLTFDGAVQKTGRHIVEKDLGLLRKVAIVTRGKEILWIGAESKLPSRKTLVNLAQQKVGAITETNLGGRHVIPAFLDSHTHLLSAGSRARELDQRNAGQTYQQITHAGGGIHSTVRATTRATDAELLSLLQERLGILRRQGVAVVEVKTGYGLNVAKELRLLKLLSELGSRTTLQLIVPTFLGAHAINANTSEEKYLIELTRALPEVKKFCSRLDIFIEQNFYTTSGSRGYLRAAKALGFDLVIHADQLSSVGASELAIELDATSAEHLIQTSPETIERLGKSDVVCTLLPVADLFLKCPYPNARALIAAGARVALATDYNPGSSPALSVQLVGVLARLEMKMSLAETLVAWTFNAALGLRLESRYGSLSPGMSASFNILRSSWDELFYEIRDDQIAATVVNGKGKSPAR